MAGAVGYAGFAPPGAFQFDSGRFDEWRALAPKNAQGWLGEDGSNASIWNAAHDGFECSGIVWVDFDHPACERLSEEEHIVIVNVAGAWKCPHLHLSAQASGQCHFGQRHTCPTLGAVVARLHQAFAHGAVQGACPFKGIGHRLRYARVAHADDVGVVAAAQFSAGDVPGMA